MCFSAKVVQSLKEYLRLTGASADLPQMEEIFRQRLTNNAMRIPRGFERNFDTPNSAEEQRIRDLLDQYRATTTTKFEQEVFAQKKRLADAQRKLKEKETKTTRNEERIATTKIDTAIEKLSLLKGTQWHEDDERIFPMSYGPIVVEVDGKRLVRLARYHLRQPGKPASIDRQFPGLYNARRDNIEKFWRQEFGNTHALMLVTSFFENVDRDGKNVVLHFTPNPPQLMWIACLYSEWIHPTNGSRLLSFAAITDEPPQEVKAAGHDRMIINIQPGHADEWLMPAGRSIDELQALLSDRQTPYYEHQVTSRPRGNARTIQVDRLRGRRRSKNRGAGATAGATSFTPRRCGYYSPANLRRSSAGMRARSANGQHRAGKVPRSLTRAPRTAATLAVI